VTVNLGELEKPALQGVYDAYNNIFRTQASEIADAEIAKIMERMWSA
jgi:hypothetical protein